MVNKKILTIVLVIVAVLAVGGVVLFKYKKNQVTNTITPGQIISPEELKKEQDKLQKETEDLQKVLDERRKTDADLDGVSDDQEKQLGTDPKNIDTDGDGVIDPEEVNTYHTDPLKSDTDADGFGDGAELRRGYDPLGPGKLK